MPKEFLPAKEHSDLYNTTSTHPMRAFTRSRGPLAAFSCAGTLAVMNRTQDQALQAEQAPRHSTYTRSADFPPKEIQKDGPAVAAWFKDVFEAVPMKPADPSMTSRERHLISLSASDYVDARKSGNVTCEEYATAVVKRARYYRYLNQFIFSTYDRLDLVVKHAVELDAKAKAEGIESIAPFYGLPIPMKGTAAVVDFPSGSGCGILSGYTPVDDSELTKLIRKQGGIIFGVTNVPEFAASWQTANPASGQTRNVYGHQLSVGGSSGGAASAVAAYICPLAVTEDTGKSYIPWYIHTYTCMNPWYIHIHECMYVPSNSLLSC